MRVLVIGPGGREHALVWALRRSPRVEKVYAAPGNGGTCEQATNVPIAAEDVSGLVRYAREQQFDLTVIGPEVPLALGLSDALQEAGLRVFGPSAAAARLESSKAFSKDFMTANGIPTAAYQTFDAYEGAVRYLDTHAAPVWVKASGLAAGKGAIYCQTNEEARDTLDRVMRQAVFGEAGNQVVLEECLSGQEVSVLAFSDGMTVAPMVLAQDHKAAYDGDQGPNTGGMGCYAPATLLDGATMRRVMDDVLQPAVDGMRRLGSPYVGVLYAGLMVSDGEFKVLEFNCRFGDPETQVILPLLDTDLVEVLNACVDGALHRVTLRWRLGSCVCVVMAAGGYPEQYRKGDEIAGLDAVRDMEKVVVFHAGTKRVGNRTLTAGGRVLGVTAWADDLSGAITRAYAAVDRIHWADATFRHDIGAKGLRAREG